MDLVHLTSPANENNQIFRKRLKEKFWNGIVTDWKDVEEYIEEDDAVLIGPGMTRGDGKTKKIVNYLLKKYPDKKFYFFVDNTISYGQLENFPFVEVWVNTACPRIGLDDQEAFRKGVLNLKDVL